MKKIIYIRCKKIIVAAREKEQGEQKEKRLTIGEAADLLGITDSSTRYLFRILINIDAIDSGGREKQKHGKYKATPNAITLLTEYYNHLCREAIAQKPIKSSPAVIEASPIPEPLGIDLGLGMVTVKKANVTGMGFGWVNSIDALLREVRV